MTRTSAPASRRARGVRGYLSDRRWPGSRASMRYSITWSARRSSVCGMVRPSVFHEFPVREHPRQPALRTKSDNLRPVSQNEAVRHDGERVGALVRNDAERVCELFGLPHVYPLQLDVQRFGGPLSLPPGHGDERIRRIREDREARELRQRLLEEFQPLAFQLRHDGGQSSDVAARSREARYYSSL